MLSIEERRSAMTVKRRFTRAGRATTIYEDSLVVKEFFTTTTHKQEWLVEHDTIQCLSKAGVAVPKSYGYFSDEHRAAIYKEFVPGKVPDNYDVFAERLAQLFVAIHEAMVITRDAHGDNVIETDAGELMFIDFGKARIFKSRNVLYWATLIREHFFIKTKMLKNNNTYKRFLGFYLKHADYGNPQLLKVAIIIGNTVLQWRDCLRHRRRHSNPGDSNPAD